MKSKVIISAFCILFASQAFSCINLSGVFDSEFGDQSIEYTLKQSGCESLEEDELYVESGLLFKRNLIFDGKFRTTYSSTSMVTQVKANITSEQIEIVSESRSSKGKLISRTVTTRKLDETNNVREHAIFYDAADKVTHHMYRVFYRKK
jgi:hypothetical protein